MSQEKAALLMMKGAISEMSEAEQSSIKECRENVTALLDEYSEDVSQIVIGVMAIENALADAENAA